MNYYRIAFGFSTLILLVITIIAITDWLSGNQLTSNLVRIGFSGEHAVFLANSVVRIVYTVVLANCMLMLTFKTFTQPQEFMRVTLGVLLFLLFLLNPSFGILTGIDISNLILLTLQWGLLSTYLIAKLFYGSRDGNNQLS